MYKRALEQRNALLREAKESPVRDNRQRSALYEPWEAHLAEHGSRIREARRRFIQNLSPRTMAVHGRMGSGETLTLRYLERDDAFDQEEMSRALGRSRPYDSARGGTSVGPHRDDLGVEIDGREARLFGSQGQQRTSVISIKMATLEAARDELGLPAEWQ